MTDTIIVTPSAPIEVTVVPASSSSSTPADVSVYTSTPGPTGPQGPTGEQGPQGDPGPTQTLAYKHTQIASSTTWSITHNLNFLPNVTTFDSAGNMVEGSITHIDTNNLTVAFSAPITGIAVLS
ncbi:hypothetical protein UFOVP115_9 [uncultured Caudovirales phage]|uniref:Collagen triple helix repeat n=1 Tax=uncultured Caudovirales phage TaxID=2100421 RepID=A0A6J5L7T5_9CAUD|nr:hypothetical protein UFOVP115_9 [uncultured Caudovirales phage]